MSSICPRHAIAVSHLTEMLIMAVAGQTTIRVHAQQSIAAATGSLYFAAAMGRISRPASRAIGYIFLVIEVADSSMAIDRGAKLAIYAKAGIMEYWIVDVRNNIVRMHRDPTDYTYQSKTKPKHRKVLSCCAWLEFRLLLRQYLTD